VKKLTLILTLIAALAASGLAQTPAPTAEPPAAPAAAPAPAVTPITAEDIKGVSTPSAEDKAKGDADGALTGTAADIAVADSKAGLTITDVLNQVGKNRMGINFVWTLICGFMVMFMQFGFAIVETGLCRAKNANHTMMMNFMVYGVGMLAYWVIGFPLQMGGVGAVANLGGTAPLSSEYTINLFGQAFGIFGQNGAFLSTNGAYDVGVMVMFLFQMVFMDTTLTIVTGSAAERWKFSAFLICSLLMGAFTYPIFANWAWGGGWLATLGAKFGLGHGYVDFAGSGVVHSIGGLSALAMAIIIGPRIGKFNRNGSPNAMPGHDITMVLGGCFVLAFGWFGFNPGSTLAGTDLRIATVAVNTMLAGMAGGFSAMFYMWIRYGKPDASMSGNGLLAGLVAITAPCGFVNPISAVIIGLIGGLIVCLVVEFMERKMKVDDPVGAIAVHGGNGLWGVIATGLFADGSYGGGWNGVAGNVKGLFYGDPGQLVAQLMGVSVLVGFVFTFSFVQYLIIDKVVGQRVDAKSELDGLDIPEMGALGYPEFELKTY